MVKTTLDLLRKHRACNERYEHLKSQPGPGWGDHDSISIIKILETNGLDDALWALRAVPAEEKDLRDRLARLFAIACVRRTPVSGERTVWDLLSDPRSRKVVEVAERFVEGHATRVELMTAAAAAYASAASAASAYVFDGA